MIQEPWCSTRMSLRTHWFYCIQYFNKGLFFNILSQHVQISLIGAIKAYFQHLNQSGFRWTSPYAVLSSRVLFFLANTILELPSLYSLVHLQRYFSCFEAMLITTLTTSEIWAIFFINGKECHSRWVTKTMCSEEEPTVLTSAHFLEVQNNSWGT